MGFAHYEKMTFNKKLCVFLLNNQLQPLKIIYVCNSK